MFTLLRNFRAMFMLTVANYNFDSPSGSTEAELKLAEAKEISKTTQESLKDFKTAMDYFSDESASLDLSIKNKKPALSKDIQELLNLAAVNLENPNIEAGKADGWFGKGTKEAVIAFQVSQGMVTDGVVTQEVYEKLLSASKIESYVSTLEAKAAREAAEAAQERQKNLLIVAEFNPETDTDNEDAVEKLQTAMIALGAKLKGKHNGVDGQFGGSTRRCYESFLEEAQAVQLEVAEQQVNVAQARVDTSVANAGNYTANPGLGVRTIAASENLLADAQQDLETIQQDIAMHSDVYARLEIEGDLVPQAVKDALKNDSEGKKLLCQLQRDLKTLGFYKGKIDGHRGIDYGFGDGTAKAFTAAKTELGFTDLVGLRRAAKLAEVKAESEKNSGAGRTNKGIDLVAKEEGYTSGDLEKFLAEYKVTANMPDEFKTQPDMTADESDALLMKQKEWIIGQAIAMGYRGRKGNGKSGVDFVEGLANSGDDRLKEVGPALQKLFKTESGKESLTTAMMSGKELTAEDFLNGAVGAENFAPLELGDKIIDAGLLDSAYIATGSDATRDIDGSWQRGTMEVPIWMLDGTINPKFAELDFENATYINGSIVMTMKNGCEGNLVIIPVQREKYIPPVRKPKPRVVGKSPVPLRRKPNEPIDPKELEQPDSPKLIPKNQWCHPRTGTIWIQWGYEGIPGGDSIDTGEPCIPGGNGGVDDVNKSQGTSPIDGSVTPHVEVETFNHKK